MHPVQSITHIAHGQCELQTQDAPEKEPLGDEIQGKTLVTLVSPGTELHANYFAAHFPNVSGYAGVYRALAVGAEVKHLKAGDLFFAAGNHASEITLKEAGATPIPEGLPPAEAVISRLMMVSMTTLITTEARPCDPVMVSGCGPVGYLAAEIFRISGYPVIVVEPDAGRRSLAERAGYRAFPRAPMDDPEFKEKIALVVECSGHEQAVLDGLSIVRKKGEVVMVGVPWKQKTDLSAHAILWQIFHKYPVLRSGWEWELPTGPVHGSGHHLGSNRQRILTWLSEKKVRLEGLISMHDPADCQAVYQGHAKQAHPALFTVFDWGEGI